MIPKEISVGNSSVDIEKDGSCKGVVFGDLPGFPNEEIIRLLGGKNLRYLTYDDNYKNALEQSDDESSSVYMLAPIGNLDCMLRRIRLLQKDEKVYFIGIPIERIERPYRRGGTD